jgi:hypothetical protein
LFSINQKCRRLHPNGLAQGCFDVLKLCRGDLILRLAEVGKVTLKSNGDEALSDESLLKSNGDEALNDDPL